MLQYIFPESNIVFIDAPATKRELFVALVSVLTKSEPVDQNLAVEALLERENKMTTAIGKGIALPHAKLPDLTEVCGCLAVLGQNGQLGDPTGPPVRTVFLLLSPASKPELHLAALKWIARALENTDLGTALQSAADGRQAWQALRRSDDFLQRMDLQRN